MPKVHTVETGKFKLDGGAMFGVVPKSMWQKLNVPDENNMCSWAMRCLLVQDGDRNILIDAGIGKKQDAKFNGHFYTSDITDFDGELGGSGLRAEDITDVLLTHLHFDHCGGVLQYDEKKGYYPTFPNAKIWTNDYHLDWALKPNDRERASFLKENIVPLMDLGLVHQLDVQAELKFSDSISLDFVYGHTGAMMIPTIKMEDHQIIFCADLMPSHCHLGLPYVMAYDTQPLVTLKEKKELLEKVSNQNIYLFLEHDKDHEIIKVVKDESGKYQPIFSTYRLII